MRYKRLAILYQIEMIILVILIIGINFNAIVTNSNQGKMPVKNGNSTKTHISYQNNNEVKYWYLSDIIKLPYLAMSIGDVLLYISMIGIIICGIVIFKEMMRHKYE